MQVLSVPIYYHTLVQLEVLAWMAEASGAIGFDETEQSWYYINPDSGDKEYRKEQGEPRPEDRMAVVAQLHRNHYRNRFNGQVRTEAGLDPDTYRLLDRSYSVKTALAHLDIVLLMADLNNNRLQIAGKVCDALMSLLFNIAHLVTGAKSDEPVSTAGRQAFDEALAAVDEGVGTIKYVADHTTDSAELARLATLAHAVRDLLMYATRLEPR